VPPGSSSEHDGVGSVPEPLAVEQFFVIEAVGVVKMGSLMLPQLHFDGDPGIAAGSHG
jgi:hypothetical protein